MISPYMGTGELLFWHAPESLKSEDIITLTPQNDPRDRLAKVLFKRDGNYVNIRFDRHPQPYIGVGVDQHSVVYKESYDMNCKWAVMAIAIRQVGTEKWNSIDRSLQLDWEYTKGREFLSIFVSISRKILVFTDSSLQAVDIPPLSSDPGKDNELIDTMSRSMFVLRTVDHSWSFHEVARGVVGAVGGVGGAAFGSILLPALTASLTCTTNEEYAESELPGYTRYPLEICDSDMQCADTLVDIGLSLQWFVSKLPQE